MSLLNMLYSIYIIIQFQLYALFLLCKGIFIGLNQFDLYNYINDTFQIKYEGDKCDKVNEDTNVILVNHISWTDFFMDNHILQSKGTYLARYLVFLVTPLSSIYSIIFKQVYYFNRSRGKQDLPDIINKVCFQWNKILIVYPEGTRNTSGSPLPLRYGGIKEMYRQKLNVQIMTVSNKSKVFNERKLSFQKGILCNVIISNQFKAADYESFESFYSALTTMWNTIYQA